MPAKNLKIDQLDVDPLNPRISKAGDQREAIQRIIEDQGLKLANLAESIVGEGLNPMDRLLVMKSEDGKGKYTVLEGNRRTVAMKLLNNPALLTSLDVRPALQKRFEKLAQSFKAKDIEPIACFEVDSRGEGSTWIEQRHSGEDEGRGIVNWSGVASSRFRGRDPALQALDFVRQHANLTEEQKNLLDGRFPITTLDRLLSTPGVRSKIGFEIKDDKLFTSLPPEEAIKPLKRIVLDLAEKKINVTKLKLKTQQVEYVSGLGRSDSPDLSKKTKTVRPIEGIAGGDFAATSQPDKKKAGATRSVPRLTVVPKNCKLSVVNPKIAEIYGELRSLRLSQHPHAIAVLLRVLLETSVDHHLTKAKISLVVKTGGGDKDKPLRKKLEETIDHMIANGATKKDFAGVTKGIADKNHPFSVDILHAYVHNRFLSPQVRDLIVAWDNAQPLFERIWP
jgi:hypothetical protein